MPIPEMVIEKRNYVYFLYDYSFWSVFFFKS